MVGSYRYQSTWVLSRSAGVVPGPRRRAGPAGFVAFPVPRSRRPASAGYVLMLFSVLKYNVS